jgi:hypothetical protein
VSFSMLGEGDRLYHKSPRPRLPRSFPNGPPVSSCHQTLTGSDGSPRQGLCRQPSRRREDAVSQEVDPGPSIGLPFQEL